VEDAHFQAAHSAYAAALTTNRHCLAALLLRDHKAYSLGSVDVAVGVFDHARLCLLLSACPGQIAVSAVNFACADGQGSGTPVRLGQLGFLVNRCTSLVRVVRGA
jgi:hypothetical protein